MKRPIANRESSFHVPVWLAYSAVLLLVASSTVGATVSYDTDGDGLIEISTLAQLNAVRWDLDGDGAVDNGTNRVAYTTAFPDAAATMGCALTDHDGHSATPDVPVCTGYELKADLDFDTDGDGDVDESDGYWNRGRGWEPIGSAGTGNEFIATFDGNSHTISHLYIRRSSSRIGLFGVVGNGGRVRNVGVREVAVTGSGHGSIVGGLAGYNAGAATSSYVTGSVTNSGTGSSYVGGLVGFQGSGSIVASFATASVTGTSRVGGLAGSNSGSIWASYATGEVTGSGSVFGVGGLVGRHGSGRIAVSYATGSVTGTSRVGGLVGQSDANIWASYATGAVTGDDTVGGLVGRNDSRILASYATGWVTGTGSDVGGLVGWNRSSFVSSSYWNTSTSGRVSSAAGEGKTTAELHASNGYTGIYASWNLDLDNADGDSDAATGGDDPWDFGTAQQYPALQADFDGDGTATWQEFGEQRADASTPTDAGTTDDATLKALGISPVDIEGFSADVLSYHIGVANEVNQVTVTPYLNDDGATIDINGSSVSSGSGHAVSLADGSNEITITVTARDATTTREYTVTADRGSNAPFGWKVTDDFNDLDLDSGVSPRGIWSSGTTMWVACATGNDNIGANLCRYNMTTKKRGADGFHTMGTWGNNSPMGIASDGTTMYVADVRDNKIYAYKMASYARDASKEINLLTAAGNTTPVGITINIGGIYVADNSDDKIYAYQRHTKQRLAHLDNNTLRAAGNTNPTGIWTDGQSMWVADRGNPPKIYAYTHGTGSRETAKDFNTLEAAGNTSPWGIWSDGTTLWVVDSGKNRIFSYNMPNRMDAALSGLTVIPTDVMGYSPDVTAYHVGVANDVAQLWIMPTVNQPGATIDISGTSITSGAAHAISLSEGRNDVTITVTADDSRTTRNYTVTVGRSVSTDYGWNAVRDFNTLNAAGNDYPIGIWSDGTTMWVADAEDDNLYAYSVSNKARDATKDISGLDAAGNTSLGGIWSDGTTMWVADAEDDKLYAYTRSSGARDASRDFNTLSAAGNDSPTGIWSDGTTMWVVDTQDDKVYAYSMTTKARDASKDFNALGSIGGGNRTLRGIWSDGTTMWIVVDRGVHVSAADMVYAYDVATKVRDSTRDFTGLDAAANEEPSGIWSDGTTLWVANYERRTFNNANERIRHYSAKIYAYNMPPRSDVGFPGAPSIRSVVGGQGSLTVTWDPPSSDGGAAITAYDLRFDRSEGWTGDGLARGMRQDVWTTGSGALSYELTGLPEDTQWDLQVRAVNARGDGPWSAAASGTATAATQVQAATDFNGDGKTDFVDFFLFADAYGSTNAKFDLDGNGTVDFADFFKFVDAFGS